MRSPCFILVVVFLTLAPCIHGWLWGSRSTSRSRVSGDSIARIAERYNGSTRWSYASSHTTGRNTNKCNIFVADVLREARANVPQRRNWMWTPIGAGEWGNPRSSYLHGKRCWRLVTTPRRGDVIGDGVHVGIVTGRRLTTSAAGDRVVINDWGYRSNNRNIIYWRHTC